jgi:hypothetical protein
MWKFAVGCGLVFAFWQPDHRLIALFVLPLIAMAFLGHRVVWLGSLALGIGLAALSDRGGVEVTAETPGGRVTVPVTGGRILMSIAAGLTYTGVAFPAAVALWAAAHTSDPARAWSLAVLGPAATALIWWQLRLLGGLPQLHRLMLWRNVLAGVGLAWGLVVTPVGVVLVDYWHGLSRYHLALLVPLVVLVALGYAAGLLLPAQQAAIGGWASLAARVMLLLLQGALLVQLVALRPDPVVWPAAAAIGGLLLPCFAWTMVRYGMVPAYRPALADLYRGSGGSTPDAIGRWVRDAVLRRPRRPDLTLALRFLVEEHGTLLEGTFSPTLETQRLLLSRGYPHRPGPPTADDQAIRWRELYDMAMGAIEAAALAGGNPHPAALRRYTIVRATAADFAMLLAVRRGRYDDALAHLRRSAGLWKEAGLPRVAADRPALETRLLTLVGRAVEADLLAARLAADPTLGGYQRRELHMTRAARAGEEGDRTNLTAELDAAAAVPVTRADRRALRAASRATSLGADGLGWLWAARWKLRAQADRLMTMRALLVDMPEERPLSRRQLRAARRSVPRHSPEWYLMTGLRQVTAGRDHKAYAAYSRAIAVARARNQSAWLQRALFMRAGLLVTHRRLDSAQRDLLASVAAQEDIRAAALDAAGRIAAGGPAAVVYEYAADRLLAAPLEPPDPAAVSTGGAGTALAAFALTELARSRELVYHLATAGELGPDADPDPELADRLDADRALRERIADLRARLDAAPPEEQPALADELRAARAERDRIWADVESDESDLAALRAGRPAAYPEVRDILADGAR